MGMYAKRLKEYGRKYGVKREDNVGEPANVAMRSGDDAWNPDAENVERQEVKKPVMQAVGVETPAGGNAAANAAGTVAGGGAGAVTPAGEAAGTEAGFDYGLAEGTDMQKEEEANGELDRQLNANVVNYAPAANATGTGAGTPAGGEEGGKYRSWEEMMDEWRGKDKEEEKKANRKRRWAAVLQGLVGAGELAARGAMDVGGESRVPAQINATNKEIIDRLTRNRSILKEERDRMLKNMENERAYELKVQQVKLNGDAKIKALDAKIKHLEAQEQNDAVKLEIAKAKAEREAVESANKAEAEQALVDLRKAQAWRAYHVMPKGNSGSGRSGQKLRVGGKDYDFGTNPDWIGIAVDAGADATTDASTVAEAKDWIRRNIGKVKTK